MSQTDLTSKTYSNFNRELTRHVTSRDLHKTTVLRLKPLNNKVHIALKKQVTSKTGRRTDCKATANEHMPRTLESFRPDTSFFFDNLKVKAAKICGHVTRLWQRSRCGRNKLLFRMFTGILSSTRPTPLSFLCAARHYLNAWNRLSFYWFYY